MADIFPLKQSRMSELRTLLIYSRVSRRRFDLSLLLCSLRGGVYVVVSGPLFVSPMPKYSVAVGIVNSCMESSESLI